MAGLSFIPSGDFRTSYAADTTIFPTRTSRNFAIAGVALLCFAPQLQLARRLEGETMLGEGVGSRGHQNRPGSRREQASRRVHRVAGHGVGSPCRTA